MTNINFPDNPSNGDRVGLQVYNATRGVWEWDALPGDTTAQDLLRPGQIAGWPVEYLVVAGGGGGGGGTTGSNRGSGGGGAGGYRSSVLGESSGRGASAESPITLDIGAYTVLVGAGGPHFTLGTDSVFASITSDGGGNGGFNSRGGDGGSGGGNYTDQALPGGIGTEGQGFDGGGGGGGSGLGGGGGGGAGSAGGTSSSSTGGSGGTGVSSSITGSAVPRAGGGGGGGNGAPGGNGGGGSGANGPGDGNSGANNTGGGGGGAETQDGVPRVGGSGGSGIVIFKLSSQANVSFSAGLTEANSGSGQTVGDHKVYTVTAGAGTVTIS